MYNYLSPSIVLSLTYLYRAVQCLRLWPIISRSRDDGC